MKKKKRKAPSTDRRSLILAANPAMIPLCELFAAVDDVFTTEGAFSPIHIHKSLGRCYRAWLDAREALDPHFDRERYRHDMKTGKSGKKKPKDSSTHSLTPGRVKFVTSDSPKPPFTSGSGNTPSQAPTKGKTKGQSGSRSSKGKASSRKSG